MYSYIFLDARTNKIPYVIVDENRDKLIECACRHMKDLVSNVSVEHKGKLNLALAKKNIDEAIPLFAEVYTKHFDGSNILFHGFSSTEIVK